MPFLNSIIRPSNKIMPSCTLPGYAGTSLTIRVFVSPTGYCNRPTCHLGDVFVVSASTFQFPRTSTNFPNGSTSHPNSQAMTDNLIPERPHLHLIPSSLSTPAPLSPSLYGQLPTASAVGSLFFLPARLLNYSLVWTLGVFSHRPLFPPCERFFVVTLDSPPCERTHCYLRLGPLF